MKKELNSIWEKKNSRLKKFLSPIRIISTLDTIAAFKIGWSFASHITFPFRSVLRPQVPEYHPRW